ncbi:hypothetical protein AB1N83_010856 [Pleurotus pulmonarius]
MAFGGVRAKAVPVEDRPQGSSADCSLNVIQFQGALSLKEEFGGSWPCAINSIGLQAPKFLGVLRLSNPAPSTPRQPHEAVLLLTVDL